MPTFVFLPPQTDTTRQWAAALARDVPELDVVVADSLEDAARELRDADAAFGDAHAGPVDISSQASVAAGPGDCSAGRLLLCRTGAAPGFGDELPRDFQRARRRAHYGFRARIRAWLSPLLSAPDAA